MDASAISHSFKSPSDASIGAPNRFWDSNNVVPSRADPSLGRRLNHHSEEDAPCGSLLGFTSNNNPLWPGFNLSMRDSSLLNLVTAAVLHLPLRKMGIAIEKVGEDTVIQLSGRLDMTASPDLRKAVSALFLRGKSKNLSIDFSRVPLIDTSGLATLLEILVMARERSARLVLKGLNDQLRYLIDVNGLTAFFTIINPEQEKLRV